MACGKTQAISDETGSRGGAGGPARAGGLLSGTGGREASGVGRGECARRRNHRRSPRYCSSDPGGRGVAMPSLHPDSATKSAPGEFSVVARDVAKTRSRTGDFERRSGCFAVRRPVTCLLPAPQWSPGQRFAITDGEPFSAQGPGLSEMRSGATTGAVLPALPARTSAGRGEDGGQPVEARSGNRARADLEARLADTPVQGPGRTTGGAEGMGIVKVRYRSGQTGLESGTASAGTAATFPLAAKPPQTRAAPPRRRTGPSRREGERTSSRSPTGRRQGTPGRHGTIARPAGITVGRRRPCARRRRHARRGCRRRHGAFPGRAGCPHPPQRPNPCSD